MDMVTPENSWLVYLLFMASGLLVGGTWASYQSGSKGFTIALGLCALVAFIGGVFWAWGAMSL